MDETEEEALFQRLHARLKATPPATAGAPGPTSEITAAALARVEASVRKLVTGLEGVAQRSDALERNLDSRIEAAVARSNAALRVDLDRLESRVAARLPTASPTPTFLAERRPIVSVAAIAVAALAIAAVGVLGIRLGYFSGPGRPIGGLSQPADRAGGDPLLPPRRSSDGHAAPAAGPGPIAPADPPVLAASPSISPPAAPHPGASSVIPIATSPSARSAAPTTVQTAGAPPTEPMLSIQATAPSWVVVRDGSGRVLLERILRPGETWRTEERGNLLLSTGFAPGLAIRIDNRPFALPNGSTVIRDLPLPTQN